MGRWGGDPLRGRVGPAVSPTVSVTGTALLHLVAPVGVRAFRPVLCVVRLWCVRGSKTFKGAPAHCLFGFLVEPVELLLAFVLASLSSELFGEGVCAV